ncbi:MAG TPA: hypothetical protein VIF57_21570 [Polyangia bacterium]|jgi:hypothetical protein
MAAGIATAATRASAQDSPEAPPESPPPAFVPPPPGYEPPTQYAQASTPAAAPASAEIAPTFLTLDRMDGTTRFGIQMGWDKIDDTSISDGFVMRYELYGQYLFPNKVVGVYGQLPISHAFNFNGNDATGMGNIEMGGFFLPTHSSELILRGGLAMSTASDSNNNEILSNVYSTYERLTDLMLIAPQYTTLRLSASTLQQRDTLFFRADLGFDLAIDKPDGATTSVWFRGNVALGVRATGVDITAELINIAAVNGGGDNASLSDRFFHTLGFSLRSQGENQFHLGTVFPLDRDARGEIWIISVGYQRAVSL